MKVSGERKAAEYGRNQVWRCLLAAMILVIVLAGCGAESTPATEPVSSNFNTGGETETVPLAEPVMPDFSQKPGKEAQYVHSHPIGTVVRYDLNGDGIGEDIMVDAHEYDEGTLTIGNATVKIWSESPTGYFTVLNVDDADNTLLVGLSDYGPSDDPATVFYFYDGNGIEEIGYITDVVGQNIYNYDGVICHGNGTISAQKRWYVLGTWNTVGLYQVNETGVTDITDFYPCLDWNGNPSVWEVTAKVDLFMYERNEFLEDEVTVPAGTVVGMSGLKRGEHDDAFWVAFEVETTDKTLWLPVERIDWISYVHTGIGFINSEEAFDGFFYAG